MRTISLSNGLIRGHCAADKRQADGRGSVMRIHSVLWGKLMLSLLAVLGMLSVAAAEASVPPLPISVGRPPAGKGAIHAASTIDLRPFGYVEEEYFVSGKANVYA